MSEPSATSATSSAVALTYAENTAHRYDAFTRRFSIHRLTSSDLVKLADPKPGMTILDLACGTGVTTREILRRIGTASKVIAADISLAMLSVARERTRSPNVDWVACRGEDLDESIPPGIDVAVCNSAFWLMDMRASARAIRRILEPAGRFVFNLPDRVLAPLMRFSERRTEQPSLSMVMQGLAIVLHGYAPPPQIVVDVDFVETLLRESGFSLETVRSSSYEMPIQADYEYLSIPAVSRGRLPGLPYRTRKELLDEAYRRCDKSAVRFPRWTAFVAADTARPTRLAIEQEGTTGSGAIS